jgi:hypothetical protein
MSGAGTILLNILYAYFAVGIVSALAFLCFGVTRVFAHPVSVTLPARVLLFPGAVVLWPLILVRWLRPGRTS